MRKVADVQITEGDEASNRDYGKVFQLTEMPAWQAEKWATRALLAVAQSGADLPPNILAGGMSSFWLLGLQALMHIKFKKAEPLLDEMMRCVKIKEAAITRALTQDDIEEIATFAKLRGEVLQLHIGFFPAAAPSK